MNTQHSHSAVEREQLAPESQPGLRRIASKVWLTNIPAADALPAGTQNRAYLEFIDGFRALAILFIVAQHCWFLTPARPQFDTQAISWISNIYGGSTTLFVFISGLLFHYISYHRWNYPHYIRKKAKNVFAPYLFVTAVSVAIFHTGEGAIVNFLTATIRGSAGYSLWYIPFILMVFLTAPLFILFIDSPPHLRSAVLLGAFAIGILVNRPYNNIDKLQAIAHFAFFYLLGIEASIRREWLFRFLSSSTALAFLGVTLIVLCVTESLIQGFEGNYGSWFEPSHINVRYISKLVLIFACCSIFLKFPTLNKGPMRIIAADSFGIFFVHNLVTITISRRTSDESITNSYILDTAIYFPFVFLSSWAIVRLIKRGCGRHSKILIGA